MGTFIASNAERHPTDLAKLRGARLVVAQETQRGRRWDETKLKALTGGDKLTARFMRQDFFDFTPTFKLFIAGNHKPRIGSVDEAMRRRLLLVPFTVRIPAAERDPALAEKLWGERSAILRWCLDGCLHWQRTGLAPPAIVCDATEDYFNEQDTVGQWLEDCTEDGGQLAFTPHCRPVRLLEDLVRGAQPQAREHDGAVGHARGSRPREAPRRHGPARLSPPYPQAEIAS